MLYFFSLSEATHVVTCFGFSSGRQRNYDFVEMARRSAESAQCHWTQWSVSRPYLVRLSSRGGGWAQVDMLAVQIRRCTACGQVLPQSSVQFNVIRYSAVFRWKSLESSFLNNQMLLCVVHHRAGTHWCRTGSGWTSRAGR